MGKNRSWRFKNCGKSPGSLNAFSLSIHFHLIKNQLLHSQMRKPEDRNTTQSTPRTTETGAQRPRVQWNISQNRTNQRMNPTGTFRSDFQGTPASRTSKETGLYFPRPDMSLEASLRAMDRKETARSLPRTPASNPTSSFPKGPRPSEKRPQFLPQIEGKNTQKDGVPNRESYSFPGKKLISSSTIDHPSQNRYSLSPKGFSASAIPDSGSFFGGNPSHKTDSSSQSQETEGKRNPLRDPREFGLKPTGASSASFESSHHELHSSEGITQNGLSSIVNSDDVIPPPPPPPPPPPTPSIPDEQQENKMNGVHLKSILVNPRPSSPNGKSPKAWNSIENQSKTQEKPRSPTPLKKEANQSHDDQSHFSFAHPQVQREPSKSPPANAQAFPPNHETNEPIFPRQNERKYPIQTEMKQTNQDEPQRKSPEFFRGTSNSIPKKVHFTRSRSPNARFEEFPQTPAKPQAHFLNFPLYFPQNWSFYLMVVLLFVLLAFSSFYPMSSFPFCDFSTETRLDCVPCPSMAICNDGRIIDCVYSGYILQNNECVWTFGDESPKEFYQNVQSIQKENAQVPPNETDHQLKGIKDAGMGSGLFQRRLILAIITPFAFLFLVWIIRNSNEEKRMIEDHYGEIKRLLRRGSLSKEEIILSLIREKSSKMKNSQRTLEIHEDSKKEESHFHRKSSPMRNPRGKMKGIKLQEEYEGGGACALKKEEAKMQSELLGGWWRIEEIIRKRKEIRMFSHSKYGKAVFYTLNTLNTLEMP